MICELDLYVFIAITYSMLSLNNQWRNVILTIKMGEFLKLMAIKMGEAMRRH